jgi:predicted nucleotidyltransferase
MAAIRDIQWLEGPGDREVIFRGISGSRAYGTSLPGSDTDIRGVFVVPSAEYVRLEGVAEQVSDERNDTVYHALRRFCELLAEANPTMLELLWLPDECILKRTPAWDVLAANRALFVTRRAVASHSGYAVAQIKKARGANKRVWHPQPESPPAPENHCAWIGDARGPARPLAECGVDLGRCRMARLSRTASADLFAVYDFGEATGGVFRNGSPVVSDVAKADAGRRIGILAFDKQAFETAKRRHRQYWDWKRTRNDARWRAQERGETDYDAKNMMHLVRLLYSGVHIVETGAPLVRFEGKKLETLLSIRRGERTFGEIMALAESLRSGMEEKADRLPPTCDKAKVDGLMAEAMERAGVR